MKLILDEVRLRLTEFTLEASIEFHGGWTGLFGPSGAGKTSLVELVAGLRRPDSGAIELDGRVLARDGANRVKLRDRRIGYVTQDDTLFPHLSVRANVLYGTRGSVPASRLERVAAMLAIEPLLDRRVGSLSGGERRRAALARALLSEPSLLLLDEPLTGLDDERRRQILDELEAVKSGFGIPAVYVAHSREEVARLCDDVIVLARGRIVDRGAAAAILYRGDDPA